VWQDRRLDLTLRLTLASFFETRVERTVEPYGLVAKANVWHLVCAAEGALRTYRAADILDAKLGDHFQRPGDFDLAAFWQTWCADFETHQPHYPVTLRIAPHFIAWLPHFFGQPVRELAEHAIPDPYGYITLAVPFESLEDARNRLLGWGGAVEVIEPEALRRSMADFAEQIVAVYSR
jgi:predicted DNA-binding transcriptional regulator YafY